jgi:hypothetical protein
MGLGCWFRLMFFLSAETLNEKQKTPAKAGASGKQMLALLKK